MRTLYIFSFLLATAALAQQATPPKPVIIDGTAVNSITQEPLRKVDLTLTTSLISADMEKMMAQFMGGDDEPAKPGAPKPANKSFATTTDASGKFHFEVEPGDYFLKAAKVGFGDVTYKPEGKYAVEGKIHLQPGDAMSQVTIRMVPHGAIAGRVIDEDGDPVGTAIVMAEKFSYATGQRKLVPADTAQTNDRGEFRLGKLPPGRYYITASVLNTNPMAEAPPLPKDGSPETGYVSTFYPKSLDVAGAGTIDVAAGADLPGFIVQLQKSRVVRIKGKAVGEDGAPLKGAQVMLMNSGNIGSMQMKMVNDPQGRFEITNVQPGTYMAMTMQMGGSSPTMHMQALVVPSEGLNDVVLGSQKDGSVQGRVVLSGNGKVTLEGLRVAFNGAEDAPIMPASARTSATGEFTAKKVAAGAYEITIQNVPEGAYLKSIQWDGKEKLGQSVDFSAGFGGRLELALGTDGGQLEATVSADGKPPARAMVVLLPADPNERVPVKTHVADVDPAGKVTFKDVAPGSYLAFAWEEVEHGAWFDPVFLKPLEMQAASVTIHSSGHEKADLKLISAK